MYYDNGVEKLTGNRKEIEMEKVVITRPFVNLIAMQVCACKTATDEEILEVCNSQNPSGTFNGWGRVVRELKDTDTIINESYLPVPCADFPDRIHYLVLC